MPIVTSNEAAEDKRKHKPWPWQGARLAWGHAQGSGTPKFAATFGRSVDASGQALRACAVAAGFGDNTPGHGVGDGAGWIAEQFPTAFGSQASSWVDFYPVCDYLAAAAAACAPLAPQPGLDHQKQHLKNNDTTEVLRQLPSDVEAETGDNAPAPVRAGVRYLHHRVPFLDDKGAWEKELPMGAGEIERAPRYILQDRLKVPGAWWKAENVEPRLTLRVGRAKGDWNTYWEQLALAA